MNMDIDFVICWVDGNDPEWQEKRQKFLNKPNDAAAVRFRDWGILRYWFRAVEQFAPWVRKVHFVTCGHVPEFLNLNAPKLHHVRHEDFMPEGSLPTFSSHALEMNLHRIPGLAEHFVYFNDDMFLLRPMPETAFFQDGMPCTYGGEYPLQLAGDLGIWQHAVVNNLALVNAHFSKKEQVRQFKKKYAHASYRWQDNIRTKALEGLFPDSFVGFKNIHGPAAYLKSTFEALWEAEPEIRKASDGVYYVSGSMNLEKFFEKIGQEYSDDEDSITVSGWLVDQAGHLPRSGETIEVPEHHLKVDIMEVNERRVEQVRVIVTGPEPENETGETEDSKDRKDEQKDRDRRKADRSEKTES